MELKGALEIIAKFEALQVKTKTVEELGVKKVAMMLRDSAVKFSDDGHPDHPEVRTGKLKSSITFKAPVREGSRVYGYVGSTLSNPPYSLFVEFGHRLIAWGKDTGRMVKPYPFMRPAISDVFDSGKAQKLFGETIKEGLNA